MDVQIPCICPTSPHDEDTITLADTLAFRETLTIRQEIRLAVEVARARAESLSLAEMTAVMAEAYLLHGIVSWSLTDDNGKPLPLSKTNIRDHLMAAYEAAESVGNAADGLYSEKVVLPLLQRESSSSRRTPTRQGSSTSPTSTPGSTPRKRSKRSSTSTSPMAVTGPMAASPGGASNSWQS